MGLFSVCIGACCVLVCIARSKYNANNRLDSSSCTAVRIRDLSHDLGLVTRNTGLVLNNVGDSLPDDMQQLAEETGIDIVGRVPKDSSIEKFGSGSGSLMDITENSPALKEVRNLCEELDI